MDEKADGSTAPNESAMGTPAGRGGGFTWPVDMARFPFWRRRVTGVVAGGVECVGGLHKKFGIAERAMANPLLGDGDE